jgi:hypothetical protein
MTEEWASLWYQCLSQNIDYSLYCRARAEDNTAKCDAFETRFQGVAELYDDFGELDGWPDPGLKSKQWQEWFKPRQQLFMLTASIVDSSAATGPFESHLRIDVPLLRDASSTTKLVGQLIADHYAQHMVLPMPEPKYSLHKKNGRLAHGLQQVRQSCVSAARSYRYDAETFAELPHARAVTEFVRNEIDTMGWSLDPAARKQLNELGTLSEQRMESFKAMLNRCRRDFKAFARNTMRV